MKKIAKYSNNILCCLHVEIIFNHIKLNKMKLKLTFISLPLFLNIATRKLKIMYVANIFLLGHAALGTSCSHGKLGKDSPSFYSHDVGTALKLPRDGETAGKGITRPRDSGQHVRHVEVRQTSPQSGH
ncbi:hypothetical protein H1C71_035359 [Ictidomys tridecemlineatus]|nr:hypothetical protein H1C71_035359 [Ictidomys tridecemlineatus]